MKKIFQRLLILLLLIFVVSSSTPNILVVQAHSGRTDSKGGHKDNKNVSGLGSYHYHCGGNPAHLHAGGVCPYASNTTVKSKEKAVPKDKIEIKAYEAEMYIGESQQLEYTINSAQNTEGKVSSSNESVIAVDGNTLYAKDAGTIMVS